MATLAREVIENRIVELRKLGDKAQARTLEIVLHKSDGRCWACDAAQADRPRDAEGIALCGACEDAEAAENAAKCPAKCPCCEGLVLTGPCEFCDLHDCEGEAHRG